MKIINPNEDICFNEELVFIAMLHGTP